MVGTGRPHYPNTSRPPDQVVLTAIRQKENRGARTGGQLPYRRMPAVTSTDIPHSSDARPQMTMGTATQTVAPTPSSTTRTLMDVEMKEISPSTPEKRERMVAVEIPPFKRTSPNNANRQERMPSAPAKVPKASGATLGKEKATRRSPTDAKEMAELRTKIKSLPASIRLTFGTKPFDIEECLRTTMVHNMSIADLVACSPLIRRILGRALKTVPQEKRIYLLRRHPALDLTLEENDYRIFMVKTEISDFSTHCFPATILNEAVNPILDGGSCVNVISRQFVERTGISNVSPHSTISIKGINGRASVSGEVPDVPLNIEGLLVPVGCIIMDNPPFDLLLGRAFMERLQGMTDWKTGRYTFHLHNRRIEIDGAQGIKPRIFRSPGAPDDQEDPNGSDRTDASDAATVSDTDDESDTSDLDNNHSDNDLELEATQALIVQAMDAHPDWVPQAISMEELLVEETQDNIAEVFFLTRIPTVPDLFERQVEALTVQAEDRLNPVDQVIFTSNRYGFCLEAPKCRDILSDTPVMLVPGLEERKIYVGDLPEVHEHMAAIRKGFDTHKNCFPLPGEMSRTLDSSKLQAPASFHIDPTVPLPKAYARKYSPDQIGKLNEYLEGMVKSDKMQKSSSPVSCNPLLVKKKDGSFRVCVNFIPVNKMIRPMAWPIPDPMTEIYKLQGCKWLSFWDCKDGYLQSPVAEHCRYLTAVAFPQGLWEYKVLPMGLSDSMQWYIRHMYEVFDVPIIKKTLGTFVDDMGMGAKTILEHLPQVLTALERMDEFNGSFSGAKSAFFVQQREFLGRIVNGSTVSADPKKLAKVECWPEPQCVRDLRAFIGFALFLACFVMEFASIAYPLFELYKHDKKPTKFLIAWASDPRYPAAFKEMQRALITAPVLIMIDHSRPIIISADTSDFATGYVVAHAATLEDDKSISIRVKYRPILFGSRKLSAAETRYFATERELLGLIYCLKKNEHLLLGKEIHVFIDHRALLYLHNLQYQNGRLTRWSIQIAGFNLHVHHRPGRDMKDSDPLSRIRHELLDGDPDIGLEDEMERIDREREVNHRILYLAGGIEPYESIISYLTGGGLDHLDANKRKRILAMIPDYFMLGGRLRKRFSGGRSKEYIPPAETAAVLAQCHGSAVVSHLGVSGTFQLVSLEYFWPGQYQDVKRLVDNCDTCQRFQKKESSRYRLHRIPPPSTIFTTVGLDTVGPLPMSRGKRFVMNIICYLSGWVESIALKNLEGRTITKAFQQHWFDRYGFPQTIITDNGSSLSAGLFKELCDQAGINVVTASAYHPHTNGKVENYNKFMTYQLARCLQEARDSVECWSDHLGRVTWTWRVHQPNVAGASPFEATFGQTPRLPTRNLRDQNRLSGEDQEEQEADRRAYVCALRGMIQIRVIRHHELLDLNTDIAMPRAFKVGQAVLLYDSERSNSKSRKLEARWRGPYWIQALLSGGAYRLNELKDGKLQLHRGGRSVNHLRLTRYKD